MPGGTIYYGAKKRQTAPESNQPALDLGQPVRLAKKGEELQTTHVGYQVTYKGPVAPSAYSSGITSPVNVEHEGTTYNGTMTIKLTKIEGDSGHVHFRLTLDLPQLDSQKMVWDTQGGQPASITRHNLLQYTIMADKLYVANDKFNSTMDDGETLQRDILEGTGSISFYRIPGATPVEENAPLRTQGLLMSAMASGENLRLSIEAPAGTPVDLKLYDMQGRVVQQLGAQGLITNHPKETLEFQLDPSLASGAYFVALDSPQGRASVQVLLSK